MTVWAIADLHLSFGVPHKKMDVFGPHWAHHEEKIRLAWQERIHPDDLVLIPGDISWAMRLDEVVADLAWIDALPGTKVMIRGNHDYWWTSMSKMQKVLPPSVNLIQNTAFHWHDVSVAGARLWDTDEYSFNEYIPRVESSVAKAEKEETFQGEDLKIFERELQRLELSLKALDTHAAHRIVMTHYPPIGPELAPSRVTVLLQRYKVETCVFGHLHNVDHTLTFGMAQGITYVLASCDYTDFLPVRLL